MHERSTYLEVVEVVNDDDELTHYEVRREGEKIGEIDHGSNDWRTFVSGNAVDDGTADSVDRAIWMVLCESGETR